MTFRLDPLANTYHGVAIAALAVALAVAAPARAIVPSTEVVVPAGARGPGAGTSVWQMDLILLNPGPLPATVEISWLERDADNSAAVPVQITVPGVQGVLLADVISETFGITIGGGAFRITSTMPIAVNSRIYNLQGTTTFGQGFEGQTPAAMVSAEGTTTAWIPGLRQDGATRSNVFALAGADGARFTLEVRALDGEILGEREVTALPWSSVYLSVADLVAGQPGDLTVSVVVTDGSAWFAGSRVDENSGDPFTLAPVVANTLQFDIDAFGGSYAGTWENLTSGTSGPASLDVTVDAGEQRIDLDLDLDGNPIGLGDPPVERFSGFFNNSGMILQGDSAVFGSIAVMINQLGNVVGVATEHPEPAIAGGELTGHADPSRVSLEFTVHLTTGTAINGRVELTKTE